jgi:RNA polymerase-binding transcription factor DksA
VDTEATRRLLLAERAATSVRIADFTEQIADIVTSSAQSSVDDEHDPEGSTIAFERAQTQALLDDARRRLNNLDEALNRLTAGTYGVCHRCGQPIAAERLAAQPAATTCIACARR